MPANVQIDTVTAVYHAVDPPHLDQALRSLADQTLRPTRCIVVADGPLTKDLEAVILRFTRILPLHVVRLPGHSGSGPAKQAGLEASDAPYVAIADADDISLPVRLEYQSRLMQESNADLLGAAMEEFDAESGEVLGIRTFPTSHEEVAALMQKVNPINHPTVCVRRETALHAGGYLDLPYLEDYDLCARMLAMGATAANHPQPLVRFRGGAASLARRRARGVTASEWRLQQNLVCYGLITWPRAVWNMVVRTGFRCLPGWLMRRMYQRIFLSAAPSTH